MAINLNSPFFRLNFTDGTFITLSNSGYSGESPGEYTCTFPNHVRINTDIAQDQGYQEVTKTDENGNTWKFYSNGTIKINDTTWNFGQSPAYNIMTIGYDPGQQRLVISCKSPLYFRRAFSGVIEKPWGGNYYHDYVLSDSIGEDLGKAMTFYASDDITLYGFSNILPTTNNFITSATGFFGNKNNNIIPGIQNQSGSASYMPLNLDDVLEDFDPVIAQETDEDPYNDPTAGEGDFDDGSSDNIDIPSLPSISAADTGFVTLFNPTAAQLKSLANYLWSDLFSLESFKKMFADPMSAILGLSILPVAIPSGGSRTVSVGNVSTNVSLPVASAQFLEISCGSVTLKRQRPGTYLDFSPYTKVDLYLPFIGTHPLNVDEVMGQTITVKYHVDILSGACTAFVKVGSSVLYQFIGSCAISIPINGNDWTNAINGVMNIAGSIGSMVLTGGATAPMAIGSVASTVTNNLKPNVEKSGSVSGAGGLMGVKRPYLIISRPNRNVAKNQNKYIGYPTFKTVQLSTVTGYNSIMDVHLDNIPATQEEIDEIRALLKQGVIF